MDGENLNIPARTKEEKRAREQEKANNIERVSNNTNGQTLEFQTANDQMTDKDHSVQPTRPNKEGNHETPERTSSSSGSEKQDECKSQTRPHEITDNVGKMSVAQQVLQEAQEQHGTIINKVGVQQTSNKEQPNKQQQNATEGAEIPESDMNKSAQSNQQEKDRECQYEELLRNGPMSNEIKSGAIISGSSVVFELKNMYENMFVMVKRKEKMLKIMLFDKKIAKIVKKIEIETGSSNVWANRALEVVSKYCGRPRGM